MSDDELFPFGRHVPDDDFGDGAAAAAAGGERRARVVGARRRGVVAGFALDQAPRARRDQGPADAALPDERSCREACAVVRARRRCARDRKRADRLTDHGLLRGGRRA